MGAVGKIVFWTAREQAGAAGLLGELCTLAGASKVWRVYRCREVDRSWKLMKRSLRLWRWGDFEDESPYDEVGSDVAPSDLAALWVEKRWLKADTCGTELARRIEKDLLTHVPAETLGRLTCATPIITVGYHDLINLSPEPAFVARPFVSFRLYGQGYPGTTKGYLEAALAVPSIVQLRRDLEARLGPVEVSMLWSM